MVNRLLFGTWSEAPGKGQKPESSGRDWAISGAVAFVWLLGLQWWLPFQFAINDDIGHYLILKGQFEFNPDTPLPWLIGFSAVLKALYQLAPNVAWYSIWLWAMILVCWILGLEILARQLPGSSWQRRLLASLIMLCFWSIYSNQITFTIVGIWGMGCLLILAVGAQKNLTKWLLAAAALLMGWIRPDAGLLCGMLVTGLVWLEQPQGWRVWALPLGVTILTAIPILEFVAGSRGDTMQMTSIVCDNCANI